MIPKATLISYDSSVYNDLIFVVVLLCLGMALCSCWLAYQKRSYRFQVSVWSGFLLLLLLGSLGLCTFIYAQRLTWRDTCAKLVASYANMIGRLDHWKIQPGDPEFFSDWSEPFVLSSPDQRMDVSLDIPYLWVSVGSISSDDFMPIREKLAVPAFLAATRDDGVSRLASDVHIPTHVQRRNQWAIAKLTERWALYHSTKQVFVVWGGTSNAHSYRLQWKNAESEDADWITVYTGARTHCTLKAPEGMTLAFRIRAEGGTPEDDPHFNQIIEILDFPAATNPYVGYAYTMRFADQHSPFSKQEQLQFIVSPISDANNNGFIDVHEMPNNIGELFPATPLAQHIREHKERAMYFDVFRDKWGKWFVIAEPIWTPDNQMDGFLAMDFRVDAVYRAMFRERIYPHCLFALVMFVYFGAVLFVSHLQIEAKAISRLAGELQHTVSELTGAKRETEKALQAKTLFLTNMSHEFRTPLNAVLGFTEILVQSSFRCVAERQSLCTEAINQIKENGKHLLELVDNLLGMAAMDGTQSPRLTFSSVHLRDLILEVTDVMRSRAEHKSLTLTVNEPLDVPEWIESDPAHIRQVLVLLLDNAIKFTQEGSILIDYGVLRKEQIQQRPDDAPMLYISVNDTGIGIEEDHLRSIFKPFSQTDPTLTRQYGGVGIGLAVARQTAEQLNGSISVKSQFGQGSTFTFVFPGQIVEPTPQERSDAQSSVILPMKKPVPLDSQSASYMQPPLAGCRILVVDDTKVNQIVIVTQLEKFGAVVRMAEDGQIGIDKIAEAEANGKPFDVILMDMQMPVLDGYEATRQLRANGYSKPIIAVTAHALPEDRAKTLEAGCNEYIPKPVDFARIIEVIKMFWS